MLVLTRKRNESIVVGEGDQRVTITVVEVRVDRVRLGIEADSSIPIHRKEVLEAMTLPPSEPMETEAT